MTNKDWKHVKINSVKALYLIFNKVNGYFEQINKNKYLTPVPTSESKEKKCLIELTFLKELMLIRQANQKSAIFVTIAIFQIEVLRFNQMSAMVAMIY